MKLKWRDKDVGMSANEAHRPWAALFSERNRPLRDVGAGEGCADQQAPARPRALLVEDHELLAQSLSWALTEEGVEAEHAAIDSAEAVIEQARAGAFDVVLLDLDLGGLGSGLDLIRPLQATGARVVMLTAVTDEIRLAECVEAGALGVVRKTASLEQLLTAVREAVTLATLLSPGQRDELMAELRRQRQRRAERMRAFEELTRREQQVLGALMDGKTPAEIATDQFVSLTTVRSHIRSLLFKFGVHSQVAAIGLARRAGWEPPIEH